MSEAAFLRWALAIIANSDGGWLQVGIRLPPALDGRCLGAEELAAIALLPPDQRPELCDTMTWETIALPGATEDGK